METYKEPSYFQDSKVKHTETARIMENVFFRDEFEAKLDIREYLDDTEYVVFEGYRITSSDIAHVYIDSSVVPIKYLQEYVELQEAKADARAWLRIWSNYCDSASDFITGLPGESNVFDDHMIQEAWNEIKQGEAFSYMEGIIFANKLLR